jgi:hypothetical protein
MTAITPCNIGEEGTTKLHENKTVVFNLFRRKGVDKLYVAIPEDLAVPEFVTGERWTFAGRIDSPSRVPAGFDWTAAEVAKRYNGFYLFQTID